MSSILANVQQYHNLTDSVQVAQNVPQQVMQDIHNNREVQRLSECVQRQTLQINQLVEQNNRLQTTVAKQKSVLQQYDDMKGELETHLQKIKTYEEDIKRQYQQKNLKTAREIEAQYQNKLSQILQRLQFHFGAECGKDVDLAQYIDDNFATMQREFHSLQLKIKQQCETIMEQAHRPQGQPLAPEQNKLENMVGQAVSNRFTTFLVAQVGVMAAQITDLQLEKQILKQINNYQQQCVSDINLFLNTKQRQTSSQRFRIVRLAIVFCIVLKRNTASQATKSLNQRYYVQDVGRLPRTEYKVPSNEMQFVSGLNTSLGYMFDRPKGRIFVRFKNSQTYQQLQEKFNRLITEGQQKDSLAAIISKEKELLNARVAELSDQLIECQVKLKQHEQNVPFERYQQAIRENQFLNDKIVEINDAYNRLQNKYDGLQVELGNNKQVADAQMQSMAELIELRRKYGQLLIEFNDMKRKLCNSCEPQCLNGSFTNHDALPRTMAKSGMEVASSENKFTNKSAVTLNKSVSEQIHNFIDANNCEREEALRAQEADGLSALMNKYVHNSLYSYNNLERSQHNVNQLAAGYDYLQNRTELGHRIFELFDCK